MLVRALTERPEQLAIWRGQHDAIASEFFSEGRLRFDYLLSRATKQ
jgi:hypothetical protein